jgi:hypothetical protein
MLFKALRLYLIFFWMKNKSKERLPETESLHKFKDQRKIKKIKGCASTVGDKSRDTNMLEAKKKNLKFYVCICMFVKKREGGRERERERREKER